MESSSQHECKAAFLASYDDLQEEISSRDELLQVLQQSGRNPSKKTLARFWKSGTTAVTYNEFCRICRDIPCTTRDDLMKAFRQIDINGDGYITNTELKKVLTTRGETMTTAEVQAIIDEVDENRDGKLDYKEFSRMLLDTQTEYMKMACRRLDERSPHARRARSPPEVAPRLSRHDIGAETAGTDLLPPSTHHRAGRHSPETPTSNVQRKESIEDEDVDSDESDDSDIIIGSQVSLKKIPPKLGATPKPQPRPSSAREEKTLPLASRDLKLSRPKNIKDWRLLHSKGCFFLEENGSIVSHRYSLELAHASSVWLTIEPYSVRPDGEGGRGEGRSEGRKTMRDTALLILRADNSVVTMTEQRDSHGRYAVRCDLSKGKYQLVPFTTGCRLCRHPADTTADVKLVRRKDDKYSLTKAFKDALMEIFTVCDLDGNDLLNRSEFTWFNQRTSGEDVLDEEWTVVEDNVEMKNGELTRRGFTELNQMEADDNHGDTDDLWATLSFMGYSRSLDMDEACPFRMDVHIEEGGGHLRVTQLEAGGQKVDNALVNIVKDKGVMRKVGAKKDVFIHTYTNDFWSCIVIENKTHSRVTISVDCSKSKNCATNRRSLKHTVDVPPKSSVIGHHLMPASEHHEWSVRCQETIVK